MRRIFFIGFACFFISAPIFAHATVRITEIMYDVPGTDTGREWVEVWNDGTETVDMTGWKFNDGSNHILYPPPQKGGVGSLVTSSGAYAIFAASSTQFISDHTVSVSVINTSMDLGQQDNRTYTLALIHSDGSPEDTVSYTTALGANGDGGSLQLINGIWQPASSTPGIAYVQSGSGGSSSAAVASSVQSNNATNVPVTGSSAGWVVDTDTISAFAGKDKEVIVGADTLFEGKAIGTALKPLENARFVWSFGDGGRAEGISVLHAFAYPGVYRVALDVSSGKYSASDFLTVNALPANIIISRVVAGVDSFIELHNETSRELDLSWWRLKSGSAYFTLPTHTFLLPDAKVIFPFRITKLPILNTEDVALLYPNGTVAVVYTKDEEATPVLQRVASKPESQKILLPLTKTSSTALNKAFLSENKESEMAGNKNSLIAAATLPLIQELPKASTSSPLLWILGVLGVVCAAVGGVFISRKKERAELTADDIEIVE